MKKMQDKESAKSMVVKWEWFVYNHSHLLLRQRGKGSSCLHEGTFDDCESERDTQDVSRLCGIMWNQEGNVYDGTFL